MEANSFALRKARSEAEEHDDGADRKCGGKKTGDQERAHAREQHEQLGENERIDWRLQVEEVCIEAHVLRQIGRRDVLLFVLVKVLRQMNETPSRRIAQRNKQT